MLKYLVGWKGYAAAAILAAVLSGYFVSLPYRLTISKMETAQANADLEATKQVLADFTMNASRINDAALAYLGVKDGLTTMFAKINEDFDNATRANPLPVDCRPDAFRVQSMEAAVAAANSATGRGTSPAVPPAQ